MQDENLPICIACGSQFDSADGNTPERCKLCDDPRQFVPPKGQTWTTLAQIRGKYENKWAQDEVDGRVWYFWTEPKFAIGQRVFILTTPSGLILWDLVSLIDAATISKIKSLGTLKAIVISHPHYYTTYATWSAAFDGVPVYIAEEDKGWLCRTPPSTPEVTLELVKGKAGTEEGVLEVLPGVKVVKAGGHFPGSLLLWWERKLFIADTIVTVPSAYSPHPRPPDQTTYSFMWSIPNMIPMSPDDILGIWKAVKGVEFDASFGAFMGMDIRDRDLKARILQSMQMQVRTGGWESHAILKERV